MCSYSYLVSLLFFTAGGECAWGEHSPFLACSLLGAPWVLSRPLVSGLRSLPLWQLKALGDSTLPLVVVGELTCPSANLPPFPPPPPLKSVAVVELVCEGEQQLGMPRGLPDVRDRQRTFYLSVKGKMSYMSVRVS